MGNAQSLSAEVVNCPHCNSSLKLNDSERKFGQMVFCPNCNKQFGNKPVSTLKKVFLPIALVTIVVFLCGAASASLTNTDKSNGSMQKSDQAVEGIKAVSNSPTTLQITLDAKPTISVTATPSATAKPTIVATVKPTVKPTVRVTIKPTAKPTPKPTAKPAPYSCNCAKTCTQIKTCAEAQYQLKSCGCKQRDADKDGIACDGAPLNCQ